MGLPLYRAPVESDIKSKIPKDPPTRARSTIRRLRRTVGAILHHHNGLNSSSSRLLARRSGRGASNPTAYSPWTPWDTLDPTSTNSHPRIRGGRPDPTAAPAIAHDVTTRQPDPARPSAANQSDPALREVISRGMSQEVVRYFGERMARLHAGTSSRTLDDDDDRVPSSGPIDQDQSPWVVSTDRPTPPPRQTAPSQPTSRLDRPTARDYLLRRSTSDESPSAEVIVRGPRHVISLRRVREAGSRSTPGDGPPESHFDGLGDRDRSLSPEGDGVWDTLLSSITPDPQPPSVGTSFASTSAPGSAAASQSAVNSARSSATSLTTPAGGRQSDEAAMFDFDYPCESSGDTDTEGDDVEESDQNTLRLFSQSYADVVARSQSQSRRDDEDMLTVESMQRVVRTLARREDIPDEWWAEVGLSRSLPREAA